MKLSAKLSLVAILVASSLSLSANAGTTTGSFSVTAAVQASCKVTAQNVDFGSIANTAASISFNAPGKVTATCTKTTPYTVSLNGGANGTIGARAMKGVKVGNTDLLSYNLYQDSGYATKFGDVASSGAVSVVGNGAAQDTLVYAQMPAQQLVTPDTYNDQITVTLAY